VPDAGLLFTDLEGSTAHLRTLGDAYGDALAQHHAIIRAAIEAEGGTEVGSEGDSIAAVLPSPAAAIRAAVAAQRGIAAHEWPDTPWQVRMAVHAGRVEVTAAGAVGIALHEAARVRSVAYGGQVVVSDQARCAIDEPIPAEIGLVDLGQHAVRDFATKVRLHQLAAPGLAASFPPPRTNTTRAIPRDRTPFIGRMQEVDEVVKLLADAPVVTIVGPGGSGKTRLAFEVARHVDQDVAVVELAGLRDGAQVDVAVTTGTGSTDADELRHRDLLLVLDNCEHVVGAVADLVASLRDGDVTVLATSREALRVSGEAVWAMPVLAEDEAVALFRDRAGVAVDDATVRLACARLAFMPLAIELAAARARTIPLDDLVGRLDDQLGVLTKGSRDVPRQQTLRATLDWSHDLLDDDERTVLRRLGVFAGGFVLGAADAVAGDGVAALDALDGLVSKSLVEVDTRMRRYRLLEPVRQYALERLADAGETNAIHERHVEWVRRTTTDASVQVFTDPLRCNAVLEPERANVASAITWALDHDDLARAVTIVVNMSWYWFTTRRSDAVATVPRLLDRLDDMTSVQRGSVLRCAGMTFCDAHDDPRPIDWLLEAEAIARAEGRDRALGAALFWLGRSAGIRDRPDIADRALLESVAVHERVGDLFGWGWSKTWLALLSRQRGDIAASDAAMSEILARAEGVPHVMGAALQEMANNAEYRGDLAGAAEHIRDAVELFHDLGDRWQEAMSEHFRSQILLGLDDDEAAAAAISAIRLFADAEWDFYVAHALVVAVGLLLRRGRDEEAATLAGAGLTATDEIFQRWWRPRLHHVVAEVRVIADDPAWASAVARGRRIRPVEWAESAITWLERAYPESASTSV
jgi:predicted ATPase